jgi:hypothetical protein
VPVSRLGVKRLEAEGELFVEALVGVLGSYTVAGRSIGGSEGTLGAGVTDDGGSYTGERGLARRGLCVGERWEVCAVVLREGEGGCAAAPLTWLLPAVMLSLREKLGWWPFRSCSRLLLPAVLCDQRFTLPDAAAAAVAPSLKGPMPSAAPLAALERRLVADGGGVARLWGFDVDGSGFASLSESEADRLTVTTDDDEMEPLRDDCRRDDCDCDCDCGAEMSAVCPPAGVLWIFMLERLRTVGLCLRPSQRLMQCGCRHGCRKQERAQAGSGDDAARRGGRARKAVVQCAMCCVNVYVVLLETPKSDKNCGAATAACAKSEHKSGVLRHLQGNMPPIDPV